MPTTRDPHTRPNTRADAAAEPELDRHPVLDEVPALRAALRAAAAIDRMVAQLLAELLELVEQDLAERATGVALDQWLAIVGRRTGADRRMLLTACEMLGRLPSLREAFLVAGTVSWAQVRAVALRAHRLPRSLDDVVDDAVGRAIRHAAGADPDVLVHRVGQAVASLEPRQPAAVQRYHEDQQFLAIQPRLDGSGGRVFGDFGPVGIATLDAALSARPQSRPTRDGFAEPAAPERARDTAGACARRRAERLIELCEQAGGRARTAGAGEGGRDATDRRVRLLVRVQLSSLLDRDDVPAALLTTLTGGRMWVRADTARQLVASRGADLRTVVLDDTGAVVGVGRRQRVAPGWLREALLALHDTCSAPGCRTAARVCDVDHARPWHPVAPDAPPGRTDLDQLAPLCATDNHHKERDGWRASQTVDGVRTWHHPRTGLTTRSMPATWRPPPVPV